MCKQAYSKMESYALTEEKENIHILKMNGPKIP